MSDLKRGGTLTLPCAVSGCPLPGLILRIEFWATYDRHDPIWDLLNPTMPRRVWCPAHQPKEGSS